MYTYILCSAAAFTVKTMEYNDGSQHAALVIFTDVDVRLELKDKQRFTRAFSACVRNIRGIQMCFC